MAKTNSNLSIDKVNDSLYAESIGAHIDNPISREEAFDFFEAAPDNSFETLGGGSYLNFDTMQTGKYVYLFTGVTSWTDNSPQGQGKIVNAVKLENKEGEQFVCAAKLIVDALMMVTQLPCMIRVDYKGKKKSRSGNNFFDLSVQVGKGAIAPAGDRTDSFGS